MSKKILLVILMLACMISMTACWDYLEVNNMLIVAGVGLDVDDSGKVFHATVEVINIEAGEENMESKIVEGDGVTIYDAVQNAMIMTGGKMFGNHCKVVVVGDKLARKGLNDVVDTVLRSIDFRKSLEILVAKDETAQSILTSNTVKSDIISYEIDKILRSNAEDLYNTKKTSMYKLHENFISNCPSGVVPTVLIRQNNGEDVVCIEGAAIIYQEKLQGFLSPAQCKLYNILTENVKGGTISAQDSALSPEPIGAKIEKSTASFTPGIRGDTLSMLVHVSADVVLEGPALLDLDLADEQTVQKLEASLGNQLSYDIWELITEVQREYGADIFDFNKQFENQYRQEWETLKEDWASHFRETEIGVATEIQVTGSGLIGNYGPAGNNDNRGNALP